MNEDIKLTDLFDVDMLQRIQDAFSKMTGLAAIITDAQGRPVTRGSNFTDFCRVYTRSSPIGCMKCEQCDKHGAEIALKVGASVTYYCHAGLVDFAAPIMAGGNMIGCFIGGQVLTEPPDITKLMQVAAEIGVELINYLQSVLEVKVVDRQEVENAAFFLYTLTDILSSIAYHKYEMHQANIEIEKVANMKSDFLANMSHEIRTPMNAVIGMAEMALREELSPAAKDYICQIKSSGKTLLTIINDILDFSKIESGKMDINEVQYEPLSLLNDLTNIINTRIPNDDVSFILDLNPNLPKTLYGDNIRIKQIITNICNNAVKFTQKGKVLLKIDFKPVNKKQIDLLVSVQDTGIGIKKQDMGKLFQSFQQVDSKRNRNIEGTGLGLAICKQLLALMKGDIQAESEYGKGSTFTFHLPQKVIDASPCIQLKEKIPANCIGYINNPYVRSQLSTDMEKLNQHYTSINSLLQLKEMDIKETAYLFIEETLFQHEMQKYVSEQPAIIPVVIVNFDAAVSYDDKNIRLIKKPVSALSIATIINNEEIIQDEQIANSDDYFDFIAPDANILVVDDNAINLTVAKGLMKPLEMHIDTALSAKEAISMIETQKYDLILMDHMMPDVDGVEATHLIRRFHKDYEKVPIIALTANAVNGIKEMFISEGMNDFIAKPIEVRTLAQKLKQWLPKSVIKTGMKPSAAAASQSVSKPHITISNLDTDTALSMLGSEQLFWSVLKDYYHAIPRKIAVIKDYEESENWKNYTIEVHALKSASRQIGATELSQKALEMENAGNAQDAVLIHSQTDNLLRQYFKYYYILQPYFPEDISSLQNQSQKAEISDEELTQCFQQLRDAIDDLNMDDMNAVIQTMKNYHFSQDADMLFQKLCESADNLDVDACEEIMNQWENLK